GKGPGTYLRMLAASRLYLDNIPHIQASWFSEGKKVGQVALHFGADDFGGTLIDENVHKATGHINTTTIDYTVQMIREAGFIPAKENNLIGGIWGLVASTPWGCWRGINKRGSPASGRGE